MCTCVCITVYVYLYAYISAVDQWMFCIITGELVIGGEMESMSCLILYSNILKFFLEKKVTYINYDL